MGTPEPHISSLALCPRLQAEIWETCLFQPSTQLSLLHAVQAGGDSQESRDSGVRAREVFRGLE